jgi:glutathione S-transferase
MQLIGMLDSPFVRRVAITMQMLGIDYDHNPLSIFRTYDEFRKINPLVKVPTLVCDDGTVLVDSTLIISHLESIAGCSLMPEKLSEQQKALQLIGVSLVAMEKVAQRIYELQVRPDDYQYAPWVERLNEQLASALDWMESAVSDVGENEWLFGSRVTQADITISVAWRFIVHAAPTEARLEDHPALMAFSERAETLPEFLACPID